MQTDYLIVGSGLTGATIARLLADAGRDVLVVERRPHLGGNVYDTVHEASGIRYGKYGPHYFRTSSDRIWSYATRFGDFFPYAAKVMSLVDGRYEHWPITAEYLERVVGKDWQPSFHGTPGNFEEVALSMMPREAYYRFVKNYTEKQWGDSASFLSASLCKRFDVRRDNNPFLTPHAKYQGIPRDGYAAWMAKMLAGIPVIPNYDFLEQPKRIQYRHLVFTGPIDGFFGYDLGRLGYRGQKRRNEYHPLMGLIYPCGQINDPSLKKRIRTIEWKHMMPPDQATKCRGSLLTIETPFTPTDPDHYEYPFPSDHNQRLYRRYRERVKELDNVLITGRLGRYKYLDMDGAIADAMIGAEMLLGERP